MPGQKKICIVGSGNWGSAIAKIIGENVTKHSDKFYAEAVKMWVFEEMVDGKKLSEIINTTHENVKYLKGHKLPENIVAVPDIAEAAADADVLIFVLPHQFIKRVCQPLVGKLKPGANAITLIKGFAIVPTGGIQLISTIIHDALGGIPVSVLMGANLANEVANGSFCETTIGCLDPIGDGVIFKTLFESPNFRVTIVGDSDTVEICGALKNIVAVGAGFIDGMKCGDNTKAAVIRIGLMEMIKFCKDHHKEKSGSSDLPQLGTFLESCGVADLITTCYGGRNRKMGEAFVATGKTMEVLEEELLGGQKSQGPETAAEVNFYLNEKGVLEHFPLFTAVHKVCNREMKPEEFVDTLRNHPVHQHPEEYSVAKI